MPCLPSIFRAQVFLKAWRFTWLSPKKCDYPFQISGIDYAAPIPVRLKKRPERRTLKGYIAIFTCISKLVEDYTSEAFMGAFHRFTSRRGHCTELHSDQGTNFVGADACL